MPMGLVVKNGSKARCTTSGVMPVPVSVTDSERYWPGANSRSSAARSSSRRLAVSIVMRPPSGVNFEAYARREDALEHASEFGLHGRVYYVEGKPAGYTLGETARAGTMFVVHYEKTIPNLKGLYQLINMDFVRSLPAPVTLINREQDLGDPGLRQAKITYRPCDFVKKYRARKTS